MSHFEPQRGAYEMHRGAQLLLAYSTYISSIRAAHNHHVKHNQQQYDPVAYSLQHHIIPHHLNQ